jgi:sialate O-acetylesterase
MRTKMKKLFCLVALAFSLSAVAKNGAKRPFKLSSLFSEGMVLQQKTQVNVWGEALAGQNVTISPSWGKQISNRTDANGKWKIKLPTPKAGGPYKISIATPDTAFVINDVLIGEVWLASGQSNMDIGVAGWPPNDTIFHSAQEIARANYPEIRFFKVPFNIATRPSDSVRSKWIASSPATAGDFSATAFFYARKLYQELKVPIGIVQSSIGGTPAEAWTSKDYLTKLGDFNSKLEGLDNMQTSTENWFKKWSSQAVPKTDEQWQNISFSDLAAASATYDDSEWATRKLPGRFDQLRSGDFDGAMWFRKDFTVNNPDTEYTLKIGAIDDMDATYINGKKIGGLAGATAANVPREIRIPKSLLIKGRNSIAIRVIDTGGPGAISGPMTIANAQGTTISLEGDWKSQLIAEIYQGRFYEYTLKTSISERPNISQVNSNTPTVLFNAMINPLVPYTIKGVIWYQGESNVGRAAQYKRLFPLMIEDWRSKWGYAFPFYFVQIAPNLYGAADQKEQSQKLRDAQRYGLTLPKTGMVSTLDVGSLKTVHPPYKQQVGARLARLALANDYGRKLVAAGPLFKKTTASGQELIVDFDFAGSGLVAAKPGLTNFEIAGADKKFVPAQASIVSNKVIVRSPSVSSPVYVRYAWSDGSMATLFNKEGLPAATFTSEIE